ncbi:MAG TPA: phytoene/squalene synthase family protein [Acetobacteraceae bacterium]|nr:phytoene/squalene synthase family protein [Acetobacteraceae bacterium]
MPQHCIDPADLAVCRSLLRGGSRSFDAAARLLPRSVRDPAVALYAFCRVADDAVDGGDGDALAGLRERLTLAYAGRPLPTPVDRAFAAVVHQHRLPQILPEALLEGFAWDAEGRRYTDLPDLRAYAVRVAGTVGAMMALLMGVRDSQGLAAAIDLGVAMQLTNIARDVGDDARAGRLYLPLCWLRDAGVEPDHFLACPGHSKPLAAVIQRLLDTAEQHYRHAWSGVLRLPLPYRAGIAAACLLYAEIGHEVARRRCDAVTARAVVSARRKAWVLASRLPRLAAPPAMSARRAMRESAYLLDAIVEPRTLAPMRWWRLPQRISAMIELLARMEQRERRIVRGRRAVMG